MNITGEIMEIYEGQIFIDHLKKVGSSYMLLVNSDLLEYLGIEKNADGTPIKIRIKADKGKHGRFIGFGKAKDEG